MGFLHTVRWKSPMPNPVVFLSPCPCDCPAVFFMTTFPLLLRPPADMTARSPCTCGPFHFSDCSRCAFFSDFPSPRFPLIHLHLQVHFHARDVVCPRLSIPYLLWLTPSFHVSTLAFKRGTNIGLWLDCLPSSGPALLCGNHRRASGNMSQA